MLFVRKGSRSIHGRTRPPRAFPARGAAIVAIAGVAGLVLTGCGSSPSTSGRPHAATIVVQPSRSAKRATQPTSTTQAGQATGTAPTSLAQPPGYLATTSNTVWFLQVTDSDGSLSGSIESDGLPSGGTSVATSDFPITGSASGDSVTISFGQSSSLTTTTGTFQGRDLVLSVPLPNGSLYALTFVPSNAGAYDTALAELQAKAQANNNLQQLEAAGVTLKKNVLALKGSLNSNPLKVPIILSSKSDLAQENSDLAATQTALAGVLAGVKANPSAVGTASNVCLAALGVGNAAYVVADDSTQVGLDAEQFQTTLNAIPSQMSQIRTEVQQINAEAVGVDGNTNPSILPSSKLVKLFALVNQEMAVDVSFENSLIATANKDITTAFAYANQANTAGQCGTPQTPPGGISPVTPPNEAGINS